MRGQFYQRLRGVGILAIIEDHHRVDDMVFGWPTDRPDRMGGMIDVGSTTRIEGPRQAPVGVIIQFFHRATNRGEQFRTEYQKMYDEGIQIALKHLGE